MAVIFCAVSRLAFVLKVHSVMRFASSVAFNFNEMAMGMPLRIDDQLDEQAKADSLAERRSIAG